MTIGEFIRNKRIENNLTVNALAYKSGISHTELSRIENGERKMPSLTNLCRIADALNMPQEELLIRCGFDGLSRDRNKSVTDVFPGLKTYKQQQVVCKIADLISLNPELTDKDLGDIYKQVYMYIGYEKSVHKRESRNKTINDADIER